MHEIPRNGRQPPLRQIEKERHRQGIILGLQALEIGPSCRALRRNRRSPAAARRRPFGRARPPKSRPGPAPRPRPNGTGHRDDATDAGRETLLLPVSRTTRSTQPPPPMHMALSGRAGRWQGQGNVGTADPGPSWQSRPRRPQRGARCRSRSAPGRRRTTGTRPSSATIRRDAPVPPRSPEAPPSQRRPGRSSGRISRTAIATSARPDRRSRTSRRRCRKGGNSIRRRAASAADR